MIKRRTELNPTVMKIRIKTKLWLGLGFLIVMILVTGLIGSYYLYKTSKAAEQIIQDNYESIVYTNEMVAELDRLQRDMIGGSPGNELAQPFAEDFNKLLKKQEANLTEIGERQVTERLRLDFQRLGASLSGVGTAEMNRQIAGVRAVIHQLVDLNMQAILRKNEAAKATARQAIMYVGLVGVLCFLASFAFAVNFPGYIANPIRELTGSIQEIANKNYSKRLRFRSNDEFGELAESFNKMAARLDEYEHSNLARITFEKRRIETIISNMHDAIIGLDEKKNILFANPVACRLLNTQEKNLVGKYAPDVATLNDLMRELIRGFAQKDKQLPEKPLKIVTEGKESYFTREVLDVEIRRKDAEKPVSAGSVIILKNITRFRELDMAKTQFLATVSHELKTPIASIKMSSKLLEDDRIGAINTEQKQLVKNIKDETERLLKITGELLDMAQLETGNINLEIHRVKPEKIIDYAYNAMKFQAEQKNILLSRKIEEGLPEIEVDLEKTAWVLVNLISNAIRYSPENAEVVVSVFRQEGEVIFSVGDQGPGIEKQYQSRLFEKFYTTPGSGKGTGLGLAISKDFIEAQKGKIGMTSELGEGSTFYFSFPA